MTRRIGRKLDSPSKLLSAAATIAAIAGPMVVGIANAPWLRAQSQPANPLAFEVVSIKRHMVPPGQMFFRFNNPGPGNILRAKGNRFTEDVATLSNLIIDAYDVRDYQISGLPDWGKPGVELYDVIAKTEGENAATSDQLRQMLQTLLADRFQLKLHREAKDLPVYELVIGKNGSKLKEVPPEVEPARAARRPGAARKVGGSAPTVMKTQLPMLAAIIANFVDRPVLDKTGLTGTYEILWDQQELLQDLRAAGKPAPSIFPAVQQLGLKLEAAKAPMQMLVIDHAERPSEN